ncbi:MAG TPA: hypothetical protein VJ672_17890 [Gemmatimonadaceae bacterium]|nr:hypothetical protein [Gemmatimonadaceae bacterium]
MAAALALRVREHAGSIPAARTDRAAIAGVEQALAHNTRQRQQEIGDAQQCTARSP